MCHYSGPQDMCDMTIKSKMGFSRDISLSVINKQILKVIKENWPKLSIITFFLFKPGTIHSSFKPLYPTQSGWGGLARGEGRSDWTQSHLNLQANFESPINIKPIVNYLRENTNACIGRNFTKWARQTFTERWECLTIWHCMASFHFNRDIVHTEI